MLEGSAAHPPGVSKAPGAWQTQESCPRKLRLRKPDGRVWCVLESSNPGATPEAQCFLLLVGSRPDREVRRGRDLDRNPGQCRGYFRPPDHPTPGCQGEKLPCPQQGEATPQEWVDTAPALD